MLPHVGLRRVMLSDSGNCSWRRNLSLASASRSLHYGLLEIRAARSVLSCRARHVVLSEKLYLYCSERYLGEEWQDVLQERVFVG